MVGSNYFDCPVLKYLVWISPSVCYCLPVYEDSVYLFQLSGVELFDIYLPASEIIPNIHLNNSY